MDILEYPTAAQRTEVYRLVRKALQTGELVRPSTCAWCGGGGSIHSHHPDYARPLMVVWICLACHKQHHRTYATDRAFYEQGRLKICDLT